MTDNEQARLVREAIIATAKAVVECCQSAGSQGVPGGSIYSALMAYGLSYDQFQSLMLGLVQAGKLRQRGHVYYAI